MIKLVSELIDVQGYDSRYKIDRRGRVWSEPRTWVAHGATHSHSGKYLTASPDAYGYLRVKLQGKSVKLHRLVAQHFVEGYDPALTVNHKDGDKRNNTPENLEWVTFSENSQHAHRTGLINARGENNWNAKVNWEVVRYIRRERSSGKSVTALAKELAVDRQIVQRIAYRRTWQEAS